MLIQRADGVCASPSLGASLNLKSPWKCKVSALGLELKGQESLPGEIAELY